MPFQNSDSAQQNVDALVGNKTTDENEFAIAANVRVDLKNAIVIGIADYLGRQVCVTGDGFADRDVFHPR